jgi:UDP-N-acetylmuramoyl-L-alanyl-D-glutamate--2,6-diaminopimelate ligase
MKTISELLYKATITGTTGNMLAGIKAISFDSRAIRPGSLFIAIRGTQSDGHAFIDSAIEKGATAIVCEEMPGKALPGITWVKVPDSSVALGIIASNFYDNPSEEIEIIGITGTNGKTTIATSLYDVFTRLGYVCGLLSTIRNIIAGEVIASTHTTPDPIQLNRLLREMADHGATYCFMEVSSHAVAQHRIAGIRFRGGIFTNLTHDHLDYHKTFAEYREAKKKFFDNLPPGAFALINSDDRNGRVMVQNTRAKVRTYALRTPADFKCRILENLLEGLQLQINGQELFCRLTGEFNAYNLTAIFGAATVLGADESQLLPVLSSLPPVEGRFDTIHGPGGITAIVDYAHTPDALKNVLATIEELRTRNEQLITVVGAGGDRDRSKRPQMGLICAAKSEVVILTSDNPRSEDPETIIEEIRKGIPADLQRKVLVISNRREAIKAAVRLARPGDIILVAGKGHEKYQEISGVKHPFDDKKELEEGLKQIHQKPA